MRPPVWATGSPAPAARGNGPVSAACCAVRSGPRRLPPSATESTDPKGGRRSSVRRALSSCSLLYDRPSPADRPVGPPSAKRADRRNTCDAATLDAPGRGCYHLVTLGLLQTGHTRVKTVEESFCSE